MRKRREGETTGDYQDGMESYPDDYSQAAIEEIEGLRRDKAEMLAVCQSWWSAKTAGDYLAWCDRCRAAIAKAEGMVTP